MKKHILSTGCIGCIAIMGLYIIGSCSEPTTPLGTKYLAEFHWVNFSQTIDLLEEDNLSLYVDYSTCIAEGQHSSFYQNLVPSFVKATKRYYSIKGNDIIEESPTDTYNRLLNIQEVNYADLKTAAEQIADGKTEGVLLTDGEYYTQTVAGPNPNNPYLATAFKKWMKKGHDIFIISEPYIEQHNGIGYNKKRFYFLFTDIRLKNNIYQRIIETANLDSFPDVQLFHLSADHPTLTAKGASCTPNQALAATVEPHGDFEIQDWSVDWKFIKKYIMDAVDPETGTTLPNGDFIVKDLKVDRNSFGGYKIKDIGVMVYDMNTAYMNYYMAKCSGSKVAPLSNPLPECTNFILLDKEEFSRHGIVSLHFDINNLKDDFLEYGSPFNYFKIDLFITETKNVFSNYASMFTFEHLGSPGNQNVSVAASIEQCLVDNDLQNQMKHSPFYSIYVKSNKY